MGWLRLDDGFADHRKLVALKTDQRRWTWLRLLIYTARYRTPIIPGDIGDVVAGATPKFLGDCRKIGLLDDAEDGDYLVHDWYDYQPSGRQNDLDADVAKLLDEQPSLSANHVARIIGGTRKDVLEAVKRYQTGSESVRNAGTRTGTARARPVPYPFPSANNAAADTPQDDPEPAAADLLEAEVLQRLDDIGLGGKAVTLAIKNPRRAKAWLDQAGRKAKTNPAGYVLTGLTSGEWPTAKALGTNAAEPEPARQQRTTCPHCGLHFKGPLTLNDHLHTSHEELQVPAVPPVADDEEPELDQPAHAAA